MLYSFIPISDIIIVYQRLIPYYEHFALFLSKTLKKLKEITLSLCW